jgi:hypothetical protein
VSGKRVLLTSWQSPVVVTVQCAYSQLRISIAKYGADLSASVTCLVQTELGPVTINLTAEYNYVPPTVAIYDRFTQFPGRNKTVSASLFWGEEALALYWSQLSTSYYRDFMNRSVAGDDAW